MPAWVWDEQAEQRADEQAEEQAVVDEQAEEPPIHHRNVRLNMFCSEHICLSLPALQSTARASSGALPFPCHMLGTALLPTQKRNGSKELETKTWHALRARFELVG